MSTDNQQSHILPEYPVQDIPSRFLGYPAGTKIFVKPFTFGEQVNLQKIGTVGADLFRSILNGVKCSGMAKNLITPQDLIFLGIYRKLVSTKHDKITAKSVCPYCAYHNEHNFSLKELKFKEPEFEMIPIEVELSTHKIEFGLLTTKDFLFCVEKFKGEPLAMLAAQTQKVYEIQYDPETESEKSYTEVKFKNDDDKIDKVRQLLGRCVDEDKDLLDEASVILQNYGLRPIDVKCEDEFCQQDYTIELEDKGVLVYPFREHNESNRSRIKLRNE